MAVVLNFGDWLRRSLVLLIFILVLVQTTTASYTIITLAKTTCFQECSSSTRLNSPEITTTSSTPGPTTTPPYPTELERFPTYTYTLVPIATYVGSQSSSEAQPPATRGPSPRLRALTAVFVLAPVSIVLVLVALFMVIRRRKLARRSISSFAGVKGWNRSSVALAQPTQSRGDEEQQFPPRIADQVRGGGFSLFPKPPTFPAQAHTTASPRKTLPEVPPMSERRPITTISEVSEIEPPVRDTGTFQTMDSELQRAFLEVRQGFRPNSTRSSTRTSMDWSMMVDVSKQNSRRDSEFSSQAGSKTDTRFSWQ